MMKKNISGFTIVELLVVLVVIAILVAVGMLAYGEVRDRAAASAAKADLVEFAKRIEIAKSDSIDGRYPSIPTQAMGIRATKEIYRITSASNWYYCTSSNNSDYALGVVDTKGNGYMQSSVSGLEEGVSASASSTCAKVGAAAAASSYGYNGSVWSAWIN